MIQYNKMHYTLNLAYSVWPFYHLLYSHTHRNARHRNGFHNMTLVWLYSPVRSGLGIVVIAGSLDSHSFQLRTGTCLYCNHHFPLLLLLATVYTQLPIR